MLTVVWWVWQILVIAVLMKWVLKRTFSVFQWEALLLLVAGITVNQLNYCKCAPPPSALQKPPSLDGPVVLALSDGTAAKKTSCGMCLSPFQQ